MKSRNTSLENYLLQHIPITAAIGIKVDSASPQQVILWAPLSNNINHKSTVFGGSLHSVATLACWGLLHLNLIESDVQIVIASSEISYLAPVASDFQAECNMPETVEWDRFQKMLQKKGKGRIKLTAHIRLHGKLCVDYSGVFVVIKKQDGDGRQ